MMQAELVEALDKYYTSEDFKHLEDNSQLTYQRDQRQLLEFLQSPDRAFNNNSVSSFIDGCRKRDSSSTVKRRAYSIRHQVNWLQQEGLIPRDSIQIPNIPLIRGTTFCKSSDRG